MVITAASTVDVVRETFPQAVVEIVESNGEQTIVLKPEYLLTVCAHLRDKLGYDFLETVTALDWLERVPRYDVVYHVLSYSNRCFIRLKVRVGERGEEYPVVPSVVRIWPAANWYEREVYDMFGIKFSNHPDLRRILMPPDWTTHPLRKDYPLSGFDLPEPHWGGQVPYDVDPGVGSYYEQSLRSAEGRQVDDPRRVLNPNQEPGTLPQSNEETL
ncbi:NADH-quinone oxidoreductase subunit C [Thermosporothrix hazakensis]|jgi:NADH-quinone oxidoreductase subunit C|uniref:NADH-quinone oxidoreductase subunit C n=2 Tax=Thermosporothrix TaxID=768650 RepID=A0A326U3L3_THEHA|nr:NADH-quinone oxidoreductase subunit C [Thermosporothrix hazakensis]PZW23420.1 NADH-quinone oxidoreductase subunit C [Thermosporothrix hazakensis]BBH89766.1 hypothetical protein KTC_45170 [Thermosporothrix sp. COM3]GCE47955.1 hypothetical protein KTH_28240 [Thermosporothrix hazakensis]